MEILGLLGFFMILGCWFGMYFRVRREHPQHPLAKYSNYMGMRKTASWRLIGFYKQQYGFDLWLSGFCLGWALVVILVVANIGG